jgi:hypothetical protein
MELFRMLPLLKQLFKSWRGQGRALLIFLIKSDEYQFNRDYLN